MNCFLTRLVDRTIGTASAIEPVRSPVFIDASSGSGKSAGYKDAGFAYGNLIRSMQILPQQTRIDSDGIVDSVSREDKEENIPVHPLDSRRMDTISAPDVSKSVTQGLTRQNQKYDVTDSRTREIIRHAVQNETVTTEPGTLTTELVPITPHSAQKIKEQPINHSVKQRLDSHINVENVDTREPEVDRREPEQMNVGVRQLKSPNSLTHVNSGSLLNPRVSPASSLRSFPAQQAIINTQEKVQLMAPKPPTIQVTIGRIEVRAVAMPPPQAPRSRKKSQPSLSLDDYLKQRSGDQQ
ncbi:MAG: hypothetical protein GQ542_06285 [Desulforhopalus sp.]|nr:hypothetical protein [Desulforhopalus sp.]